MRINFNYEGASTHSAYLMNQREMGKSLLRLSTGMRILEASDDAAGLFIADQLSVVATGLEEGNRNIRTGISALRIAENAAGQIFERLRGIYARATRAANDINDPNARASLQREISNLRDAIQKIGTDTEYNGIKLLDGTFQGKYIHYGPRMDQVVNVSVSDLRAQSLGAYAVTGAGAVATGTVSTTGGTLANLLGTGGSLASATNFIFANGEYVEINDVRVYENTSTTNYLVDAATLANKINNNEQIKNAGIEARATNVSLANNYSSPITSVTGTIGDNQSGNFQVDLRFYIGDGTKTFTVNFATISVTDSDPGAGVTFSYTLDQASLDELVARINSAAGSNGAPITAINDNGRLKLKTDNGETIAVELSAVRSSGNGTLNFNFDFSQILQGGGSSVAFSGVDNNTRYAAAVKTGTIVIGGFDTFKFEYSGVSDDGTSADEGLNFDIASGENVSLKNLYAIDVTSNAGAETAMMIVNKALQKVDTERSQIGAVMNNLQSIFDAQKVAFDNTKEAENVIRNTDYAEEMSRFTTLQIKMQSAIAMLAQANQMPQLVLQLLR